MYTKIGQYQVDIGIFRSNEETIIGTEMIFIILLVFCVKYMIH